MPMPSGSVRNCPATSSQGLGKNKRAAWEFIKWALSPEMLMRVVKEHHHMSVCRRSVIESGAYREISTVRGQDFGALYLNVLELPTKSGNNYMAYRTVPEFSLVGEVINQAVNDVVRQKQSARAALDVAQQRALAALGTARNVR